MNFLLWLMGYKNEIYSLDKQYIIIFPHTTKLEAFILLCLLLCNKNIDICFYVANKYMKLPILGTLLKYFGAIDVKEGEGMVDSTVEYLKKHENKSLLISPEGSLSFKEWKSGFFHIARLTSIPIIIGGVDFHKHRIVCNKKHLIYIQKNDKYGDRVEEIKNIFSNSRIYPCHPEHSNPPIIGTCGFNENIENVSTSYFPFNTYLIFSIFIFYLLIKIIWKV